MLHEWGAFDDVFNEFCERHPQIGLAPGRHRAARMRSVYGDRLMAAGVAVKLRNRQWMAHRPRFGDVFAKLYLGAAAAIVERAQARAAAEAPEGVTCSTA